MKNASQGMDRRSRLLRWLSAVAAMIALAAAPVSGEPDDAPVPGLAGEAPEAVATQTADSTLLSLHALVQEADAELREMRETLEQTPPGPAATELEGLIHRQEERLANLRRDLRIWATGVDDAGQTEEPGEPRTLQDDLRDLLQPVIGEWRDATAGPRDIEEMRANLRTWREREADAAEVRERLVRLQEADDTPSALAEHLATIVRDWEARQREAASQIHLLEGRLAVKERETRSTLETVSDLGRSFWRTRGINLVGAAAAFVAVFWLSRLLYKIVSRRWEAGTGGGTRFFARLTGFVAALASSLLALAAALLVFYIRGDWLLLTLVTLLLVGAVWGSRHTLLTYLEQLNLLLNIGTVREGERILRHGLPYLVDRLGMVAELENPALEGSRVRLPLRFLVGEFSRPFVPDEPWFPTRKGEWVLLSDGTFGRVVTQTPEQVVVELRGTSPKTFPALAFLDLHPVNLSRGFRIRSEFGIDYAHAAESTTRIPQILSEALTTAIGEAHGADTIKQVRVEFAEADDSSLEIAIRIDMDGSVAERFNQLHRLVQRVAVDTAVREGWTIPFPQLTLHRAN